MAGRNYRDLEAWQTAMDLVESVYAASRGWPREEIYGLTSQIRRAAISIPSNIAEGQGRGPNKEFMHHLSIAHGSLREVETQIMIAQRLGYLENSAADGLLLQTAQVGRLIKGLANWLLTQTRGQPVNGKR